MFSIRIVGDNGSSFFQFTNKFYELLPAVLLLLDFFINIII